MNFCWKGGAVVSFSEAPIISFRCLIFDLFAFCFLFALFFDCFILHFVSFLFYLQWKYTRFVNFINNSWILPREPLGGSWLGRAEAPTQGCAGSVEFPAEVSNFAKYMELKHRVFFFFVIFLCRN